MRSKLRRHALSLIFTLVALTALTGLAAAADPLFARMDTDQGQILLVFYPELAPHHVDNFVHLARTGFFNGTRFHRIVPGFVIQGGDPNSKDEDPRNDGMGGPTLADVLGPDEQAELAGINDLLEKRGYGPLPASAMEARLQAEFSTKAKHLRGTLSMARSRDVDSAGSQFFICVAPATSLNGQYTIFGHVVTGLDVADTIVNAETNPAVGQQYPAIPVAINGIGIIEGTDGLTPAEKEAWDALPSDLQNVK